ncbi:MAG TPA: shikimate dehydrogenase [Solirubrobacteraceae bacterium]|nr:shikimate dehydrogenase [Solirubrobacteraceae bacterium]
MNQARGYVSLLTGSFSTPAAGNPTVVIVDSAYRHRGLDARHIICEVSPESLGDAVRGARAMGWAGFNCSVPHKVAVITHLDRLAVSAEMIGAVNCVVSRDGELVGENTDGRGFVASLQTVIDPAGQKIVLFGAGGAAQAIAVESALAGATSITVVNRSPARGAALVQLIRTRTQASAELAAWSECYRVPEDAGIVVNATSIGLSGAGQSRLDLEADSLARHMVVADVIPNPARTAFLEDAQARGCTTLDGRGMLVNQAVIGIGLWTGVEADATVMRRALESELGS